MQLIKIISSAWRDGPAVKSSNCSSKGPKYESQQPHAACEPSVMGDDVLFWCVWRHCTHIQKINKSKKNEIITEKYPSQRMTSEKS